MQLKKYEKTFTGTRINRTIQLLLNIAGIKNTLDDRCSGFDIEVTKEELISNFDKLTHPISEIDKHITVLLENTPTLLDFSKWGIYLPEKYQVKLIKDKYFNIEDSEKLLNQIRMIENR